MASIVKHVIKGHTYLYETEAYRDTNGHPKTRKKLVGKLDPETGTPIYKEEYIERMRAAGTPIEPSSKEEKRYSINDIKKSSVKEYGAFYLYSQIGKETGLLEILKDVFPDKWEQIFQLACYLVTSGEPVMYCCDWIDKTEVFSNSGLSPSAISELYKTISFSSQAEFYEKWASHRCEREYLALDITSVSSYSELITDVEWGYNRDKEKLPQINLCLLMGEDSGLPVFQTIYSGSLKDVSTLKSTLKMASSLPLNKITLVMDKGFCSKKNISVMLNDKEGIRFLIAAPFTLTFAKQAISTEKDTIDTIENTLIIGEDSMRGVTRELKWDDKHTPFIHIFYNALSAAQIKEEVYSDIAGMLNTAKIDPENKEKVLKFRKYLDIHKKADTADGSYEVSVRYDSVAKRLSHSGWLVLVGNHITSADEAIAIYRAKDVVEKGFERMKNSLDLGRLRVHSDMAMQSKVFICFIALIIECRIHRVMLTKGLYKCMTMKKLILDLEKLRVQYIRGERILFPLTKGQKDIFKAFGFKMPD